MRKLPSRQIAGDTNRRAGIPVILLHGTYSKRNFWISPKGVGLGAFLADRGFDVWIPELRGHGHSPKESNFSAITAEQQIRYDLPAIQHFVFDQTRFQPYGSVTRSEAYTRLLPLPATGCLWIVSAE